MCEPQGLSVLGILSEMGGTAKVAALPVAGVAAAAGAAAFLASYAVLLVSAAVVFASVMGTILWAMRRAVLAQGRARAATLGAVTTRRGQGVRAISAVRVAERRRVVQVPVLELGGASRVVGAVPAELDAPPAAAVAGLRDDFRVHPRAVVGADLAGSGWAYRDPGLDGVTRKRADEIGAGHRVNVPRLGGRMRS